MIKNTNKEASPDLLNAFFTNIDPKLAAKINSANTTFFFFYQRNHIEHIFSFALVDYYDVTKIMQNFKPKSSTAFDNI